MRSVTFAVRPRILGSSQGRRKARTFLVAANSCDGCWISQLRSRNDIIRLLAIGSKHPAACKEEYEEDDEAQLLSSRCQIPRQPSVAKALSRSTAARCIDGECP